MEDSQFNKRWHSPTNVFMHLDKISKRVGEELEKSPKYQKARETRIAAIVAFVLSRLRNLPTYIRLPLDEPPDVYLMQPNLGTMDIATVELTSYRSSTESLLDQLKRKKLKQGYSSSCLLLIELFTENKVDYEAINKHSIEQNICFPIWTLRKVQQSPDTIAEVMIINPNLSKFLINVGRETFYFKDKYKVPQIFFSKRVGNRKNVRFEQMPGECNIAPWECLEH